MIYKSVFIMNSASSGNDKVVSSFIITVSDKPSMMYYDIYHIDTFSVCVCFGHIYAKKRWVNYKKNSE